jgi:hypothetical protein
MENLVDAKALENLDLVDDLLYDMIKKLCVNAEDLKHSHEASVKEVGAKVWIF